MWLWPTGLYWKSKAILRVPPVSNKFNGTVTHGTGGVFLSSTASASLPLPVSLTPTFMWVLAAFTRLAVIAFLFWANTLASVMLAG